MYPNPMNAAKYDHVGVTIFFLICADKLTDISYRTFSITFLLSIARALIVESAATKSVNNMWSFKVYVNSLSGCLILFDVDVFEHRV